MKKKLLILLFIITMIFNFSEVYAKKYDVNFQNVSMKDFITFVSEFTGKNVIYDEANIRGHVTIDSQKEMDSNEVLDVFYSILKMNGYLPIVKGNNIQIIMEKDVPTYDEDLIANSNGTKSVGYLTTVIALEYYSAPVLLPVLNRIKSRTGYVEAVRGLNILVVKDSASRINKMSQLVKRLDREANAFKLYTITLKYAVASKVEQQIVKLYGELGKNALAATVPVVVSDDMSNTLAIAATEKDYERIEYLVSSFDSKSTIESTAPKVYYLKNAKAEDVEKVINKLIGSISPQSPGGTSVQPGRVKASISSDKATNSIIVIGDQELYANIGSLVEKMDIPRRQVYVEALILETTVDQSTKFGVEWFGAGANNTSAILGGMTNSGALGGLIGPITQGQPPDVTKLPTGFSLGVIGNIISYQGAKFPTIGALISVLGAASGVSIVSNPQILTLDNEEAEVFVGENRPYVTSEKFDSNNNPIQTFDYRNVGIKLKITPQISSNDMVTLSINQEVDKISPSVDANSTAPVTLKRSTKTTVKLQDKSIMVISGMIKDDSSISNSGIPFLSKIPILGWLFKTETTNSEKTNMMVFITTKIINTVEDTEALLKLKKDTLKQFNKDANDLTGSNMFINKETKVGDNITIINSEKKEKARKKAQEREEKERRKAQEKEAKTKEKIKKENSKSSKDIINNEKSTQEKKKIKDLKVKEDNVIKDTNNKVEELPVYESDNIIEEMFLNNSSSSDKSNELLKLN